MSIDSRAKLVLKQIYSNGAKRYAFKLCCKSIIKIYNPCPKNNVALQISKCIQVLDTVFCVDVANIKLTVQNTDLNIFVLGGSALFNIALDKIEHDNIVCVSDIFIIVGKMY